jgi:hypothetical protein
MMYRARLLKGYEKTGEGAERLTCALHGPLGQFRQIGTDRVEPLTEPEDPIPGLASPKTFSAIYNAILDPEHYCKQLTSYPAPLRQMEPVARWQTRAVMCALGRLNAPPLAPSLRDGEEGVDADRLHGPEARSR